MSYEITSPAFTASIPGDFLHFYIKGYEIENGLFSVRPFSYGYSFKELYFSKLTITDL